MRDAGAMAGEAPGRALALDAVAALLSEHVGAAVELEVVSGPRGRHLSPVARCRVHSTAGSAPETVVVKQAAAGARGHLAVLNEWAALAFLGRLGIEPPVAPAFYGGDLAAGMLVIEDLGDGGGLVDALLGADAGEAQSALLGLAVALGRLHTAGAGRLDEYEHLRYGLGPAGGEAIIDAHALAARFEAALAGSAIRLGTAAPDVDAAIARISDPGPFRALVHGDVCPSNERLRGGHVVLLDFATAGVRHGLLDAVCGEVPFPSCWCVRRLPEHIPALMQDSYRVELARGCPAAADDEAFELAVATATAYWLIETTTVALPALRSGDSLWGLSTNGERLALRAERFAQLAEQTGHYRALAALLVRVVETLNLSAARMPLYPAFGGPAVPTGNE